MPINTPKKNIPKMIFRCSEVSMAGIDLYDYQLEAVKKMKNGCILSGGVGSGKSRTAR